MLIFDLHYIGWRAFHSMGHLKTSDDVASGLILGALQQIHTLATQFKNERPVVFACDSLISKRKEICPSYKATRETISEGTEQEQAARIEALTQIIKLKTEVLPKLGFKNVFQYEGYEADDIIAALAFKQHRPLIITNDDDLLQLLNFARIYSPTRKMIFDKEWFMREKGIPPSHWPSVKAIAGCSSDNVKGVRGVGESTALKWLLHKLKPGKKASDIEAFIGSDEFQLNVRLVTLPFDDFINPGVLPDEFSIEGFREVCERYEFQQLAKQEKEWAAAFAERKQASFRRKGADANKQGFGI